MAVFTVTTTNDGGTGSLRQAVSQANATTAADTIRFAASVEGQTLVLTGGQLTVTRDVTIDGDGDESGDRVTIDADQASRVLTIEGGGTDASLDGLVITGGRSLLQNGGGILVGSDAGLALTDSVVTRNDTSDPATSEGSGDGGGIFADAGGRLTIERSTISDNDIGPGYYSYGRGGGIATAGDNTVAIRGSIVSANESAQGGGASIGGGSTLTIEDSTFSDNFAFEPRGGDGGGLYLGGSVATITGSTFSGNGSYYDGGGILADDSRLSLVDSTISGNGSDGRTGPGLGGGLLISGGEAVITGSTITGNLSGYVYGPGFETGGGIFADGSLVLDNTIVAGNFSGNDRSNAVPGDIAGTVTSSNGHNVFGSDVRGAVTDSDRETVDPAAVFAILDPDTGGGRLALNGGPTPTVALRDAVSNPALSGADPSGIGGTDQRGVVRPQPGTSNPDIGAFELNQGAISTRPSANNDVITGTAAANTIDALDGNDLVRAGAGNDVVGGAGGADTVRGEGGSDRVNGAPGSDLVRGGDGDDNVRGGPGQDRLFGDPGRDVFDFDLAGDSPPGEGFRDVVGDFARGTDRLDIASIPTGKAGQAAFRFVDTAGFTAAGQVREAVVDGRTVVQGNTDADRTPEFEIELASVLNLSGSDFIL